jgi:hypothetical protein
MRERALAAWRPGGERLGYADILSNTTVFTTNNVTLHHPSSLHCTHIQGRVYFVKYRRSHATSSSGFAAPLITAVPEILVYG